MKQDKQAWRTHLIAALSFMLILPTANIAHALEEKEVEAEAPPMKTQLKVTDVDTSKKFYQDVFSMNVVEEWNQENDRGVILRRGEASGSALLELYQVADKHDFNGVSLQFEVESAEKFVSSLPEDIIFEGPAERPWGAIYVYLKDPSGVDIIVYENAK